MPERNYHSELEADAMMDSILEEASDGMSPTITPFEALGSEGTTFGMTAVQDEEPEQTDESNAAHAAERADLWQTFRQT